MSEAIGPVLQLESWQRWRYDADEMSGICEIAMDRMTVQCSFESDAAKCFFDVLAIDATVRRRLESPVSVERLAEQLSKDFPSLRVTVRGRAKTHGWITSTVMGRSH